VQPGALYREHVTIEGERWDQISLRHYGEPFRYEPIIVANPEVAIVPILPSGLVLRIPLLDEAAESDVLDAADLPPWKRPAAGATDA
jgi:phage tail protein X